MVPDVKSVFFFIRCEFYFLQRTSPFTILNFFWDSPLVGAETYPPCLILGMKIKVEIFPGYFLFLSFIYELAWFAQLKTHNHLTACKIKTYKKVNKIARCSRCNVKWFSDYENWKLKLLKSMYDFCLRQPKKPLIKKNVQVTAK